VLKSKLLVMSACLHLCNLPGPNSERICTLTDHAVCREQRWGTLSRLESPGRARQRWWGWALLPAAGWAESAVGSSRTHQLMRVWWGSTCVSSPPERDCGVGSSESQHFPRKQKQICLVINLTYVWLSLAFCSSDFITVRFQQELEIQYFNRKSLELKLCDIQLYFPASFMTLMKKDLNN